MCKQKSLIISCAANIRLLYKWGVLQTLTVSLLLYRGYGLWTEEVGGVTPCFSTLPSNSYLTPPPPVVTPTTSAAPSAPSTVTNTIINLVYARNYPVQGSGGLTVGGKAGVGTGVGIAGLAALAGLGFLLFRRRRKKRISEVYAPPVQQFSYDPAASP